MKPERLSTEVSELGAFDFRTEFYIVEFDYDTNIENERSKIESSIANEYEELLGEELSKTYNLDVLGHRLEIDHTPRKARGVHTNEGNVFVPQEAIQKEELENSVERYMDQLKYGE